MGYAFINFTDPLHIILFVEVFADRIWLKYKSEKKTSINYADKQGKKDIAVKDDSMYFAANDNKASLKLKAAVIEIPTKFLELYKKLQPSTEIILAKAPTAKGGVPTFTLKSS